MKKTKYFPNRVLFWKHVEQYCEGLDLNRTLRLPTLYFSKNGVDVRSASIKELILKLNKEFGTGFDEQLSRNVGQKFTLFYKGEEKEGAVETKTASPLISLEVASEDVIEVVEDVVEDPVVEAPETESEVDWDFIWSLDNPSAKSESKDALEKHCIDKFSIDLRKNQTFANMVKELKGKLED